MLLGASPALRQVLAYAARFARAPYPVLILGEPGTGKTSLAKHIHAISGRPGPFVAESAAGIPAELAAAQLGGHIRGAYTGAHMDRVGLIESAHKGTFVLDELGVASPGLQALLLRLLDENVVRRVGDDRVRHVDVRFIAATNADLDAMIRAGEFRQDLRDRFGYFVLRMPRLAERREDIVPLAGRFLQQAAATLGWREWHPRLSDEAREYLLAAPWPDNVRGLQSACRYAVVGAEPGQTIELGDLPPGLTDGFDDLAVARHGQAARERLRRALDRAGGNKSEAARRLGISRTQVYRLLAEDNAPPGSGCNLSAG